MSANIIGNGWIRTLGVMGATVAGIVLILALEPETHYMPNFEETRPFAIGMTISALLLAGVSLMLARTSLYGQVSIAWRMSVRLMGWLAVIAGAGMTLSLIVAGGENTPDAFAWEVRLRVIETVIPLILGLQAALIFSPPDEPALEIALACPRPVGWMLVERLLAVALSQIMIVVVGIGLTLALTPDTDVFLTLVRWLPPSLLLMGIGTYVTLHARLAAFGAVIVGVLWFVLLLFTPLLMPGNPIMYPLNLIQPFLWVVNPYVQPELLPMDAYWLNRVCVTLTGLTLIALSIHYLNDEERLLGKDD